MLHARDYVVRKHTRIGYRRNSHALIMVQYRPNCDDRMIVPTI